MLVPLIVMPCLPNLQVGIDTASESFSSQVIVGMEGDCGSGFAALQPVRNDI